MSTAFTFFYQNSVRISPVAPTRHTPRTAEPISPDTLPNISSSVQISMQFSPASSTLCSLTVPLLRYSLYCYTCMNQTRTPTYSNEKSRLPSALLCSIINITAITSNPVLPAVADSAHLDPLRNMSLR